MIRHSRPILLIAISASLIVGSTFAIQAQFRDDATGRIRAAQNTQRQPTEGQPAPEVIGYWQALTARSAGPLAVSWNKRTGTPESIFGKLSRPMGDPSEMTARHFLAENAQLFKMRGETEDLDLARSFESPLGEHFVFEQRYQGVPVYGAQAAVHFNRAGEVVAVNNTYQPGIALESVEPQLSRFSAFTRANVALGRNRLSQFSANLVVYSFNDSFLLAWHVIIPTDGRTWEMFVDAQRGELLGEPRDTNRYVNGAGQVFVVNAIVATRDNSLRDNDDAASAVPAQAYSIVTLQGLVGNGFLDGPFASSSKTKKRAFNAANNFIFDRSDDGFSETMGYYYLDYAQRYIQTLGLTSVNNRQQVFSVNRYKQDNSFYSPNSKEITLGLGGVDDAEDADVIVHEYGHSIQDNQVPGFGSSLEAGSMGEGFGDYWAGSVGAQFSGGFQDTCLAEWDATSYSTSNPPCLRRLDGTKHYPENVVGEVHDDGEIWSAALWQIREAIGAGNADKAILTAHFLLTPGASFNQGANALVTAAINLGYSNRQVNLIRAVLSDRGFAVTA
ncbi:MAG: M36 family metallopeptidase [Acidobacteriota bacterium]